MKVKKVEDKKTEDKKVIKEDADWNTKSHVVLSSDKLLSNNSKDIKQLLQVISKKYNVSVEDAAFALTNVFKKMSR
jgi:hypothetical protein